MSCPRIHARQPEVAKLQLQLQQANEANEKKEEELQQAIADTAKANEELQKKKEAAKAAREAAAAGPRREMTLHGHEGAMTTYRIPGSDGSNDVLHFTGLGGTPALNANPKPEIPPY